MFLILGRENDPVFSPATNEVYLNLVPGTITAFIAGCRADTQTIRNIDTTEAPGIKSKRVVPRPDSFILDVVEADDRNIA